MDDEDYDEEENSDGNEVDDLENIVNNLKAEIMNLQIRFQGKSPQKLSQTSFNQRSNPTIN